MGSIELTPEADDSERKKLRGEMVRALARGGMSDIHVISLDSAAEALTRKRFEIIDHLKHSEASSVSDLARQLDRDKGDVSRDLQVLAKHGIIEYEESGQAKSPRLTQEHLLIEPIF